jgi:hypothetical protein
MVLRRGKSVREIVFVIVHIILPLLSSLSYQLYDNNH